MDSDEGLLFVCCCCFVVVVVVVVVVVTTLLIIMTLLVMHTFSAEGTMMETWIQAQRRDND